MNSVFKYSFLLVITILAVQVHCHSQGSVEVKNVTVINEDNDVRIEWAFKDTANIEMGIYTDTLFPPCYSYTQEPFYNIKDTSDKSYTHENVTFDRVRSYIITQTGNPTGNMEVLSSKFNTTYTTLHFDTCNTIMNISWSRYFENTNPTCTEDLNDTIKIARYHLWKKVGENSDYQKIETTQDTSYRDDKVEYNQTYSYYVEAVLAKDTSIKSASNRVSMETRMPYDPNYINTDEFEVDNSSINLQYTIAENSEIDRFTLLRGNSHEGPFDTLETTNIDEYTYEYQDRNVNPGRNVYYYNLAAVNQCNNLTTHSDTVNNIVLNVKENNLVNELKWTPVMSGKVKRYEIYRKIGSNPYSFRGTTQNLTFFDNEISAFMGRDVSGTFCYYVRAILEGYGNNESVSVSNKTCVYIKPRIFIPNTIIPNAKNLENQKFRPRLSFLPQEYLLIIYNRSGNKVFQTNDPEKPWNGTIQGNEKASSGTYIYYLEYQNPDDKKVKKRGQITVIYR